MSTQPKKMARVVTLEEALQNGFVPDNGLLKNNKTGVTISQSSFMATAGKVRDFSPTNVDQYPAVIDNIIFPKELVAIETNRVEKHNPGTGQTEVFYRFDDNTLAFRWSSSYQPTALSVETLKELGLSFGKSKS